MLQSTDSLGDHIHTRLLCKLVNNTIEILYRLDLIIILQLSLIVKFQLAKVHVNYTCLLFDLTFTVCLNSRKYHDGRDAFPKAIWRSR
jgi:hypothetical protein